MLNRQSDEDLSHPALDWICGPESESAGPAFTSLRQILDRELPTARSLGESELIGLLNAIEVELMQHHVKVDFLDTLPARVAYQGILQLFDTPLELSAASYRIVHLDGCDSACESCFQLAHCAVAREILGSEWRLAVEQAGINPSWSALFAREDEE